MGQVTRGWHSRQCPRSPGTYRKPGVTELRGRGTRRAQASEKVPKEGAWKGQEERGYCNPSRVWGVVGSMRRGTEEKKTKQCAHAQHKQMAEQKRMARPRACWRQGRHVETINWLEHEVLFGSANDVHRKHQVEEPGLRG